MLFEKIRNWHCKLIYSAIAIPLGMKLNDQPVGQAVTRLSLEREFKSRASQIRQCCQRLATAATFLRKEQCCLGAMTPRWAQQTHYIPQRNTTSIKKIQF